jgi:hypothetical protein
MRHAITLALTLLVATGCGSGPPENDDPAKPGKTGKDADERPAKPLARPGSGEGFTPEERGTMEAAWKAFLDDSPDWPLYRDDWVSLGQKATNTLVENLLRAMVLARIRNYAQGYDRARKELMLLGPATLTTVAGALERGTYRDSAKGEDRPLSSGTVSDFMQILVALGAPAVEPISGLLESETPAVRRSAAEALGRLRDPRGFPALRRMLAKSPEWPDRMIAARSIALFGTPEAARALVAALEDPDESVVVEAARGLARIRRSEAVAPLERRRKKAEEAEDFRIERACRAAVKTIRGRP